MSYAILSEYRKLARVVVFELGWAGWVWVSVYAIPAMVEGQNEFDNLTTSKPLGEWAVKFFFYDHEVQGRDLCVAGEIIKSKAWMY